MPPRVSRRKRTLKSGKVWVGYYYRCADGREIPLGTDLNEARRKWAELEAKPLPMECRNLNGIFDRYEREIIPKKAARTQRDNKVELRFLREAFGEAPIEAITPFVIAQYRDKRSAKTRANREIALFSHIFNTAREWGLTDRQNPCAGVRRNKEKPRDYYATEEVWLAVYSVAPQEVKDAMDLAYLTGQRPADVLAMRRDDIVGDFLLVKQKKTEKKLRIRLNKEDQPTGLGLLVEALILRGRISTSPYLIKTENGVRLTLSMLRVRWEKTREEAATKADETGQLDLAIRIRQFQFRDIRPKAASEIEDLEAARQLLGHTNDQITGTVYRRVGEIAEPTK